MWSEAYPAMEFRHDPIAVTAPHKVAVGVAAAAGLNPDRPRNLTRSVILDGAGPVGHAGTA
jgi:hypothetical protein